MTRYAIHLTNIACKTMTQQTNTQKTTRQDLERQFLILVARIGTDRAHELLKQAEARKID